MARIIHVIIKFSYLPTHNIIDDSIDIRVVFIWFYFLEFQCWMGCNKKKNKSFIFQISILFLESSLLAREFLIR